MTRAPGGHALQAGAASCSLAARPCACPARCARPARLLERVADAGEERGDLAAQEDQRHDHQDGDEGDDQRVLDQPLPLLLPGVEPIERLSKLQHRECPPQECGVRGDLPLPNPVPPVTAPGLLLVEIALSMSTV